MEHMTLRMSTAVSLHSGSRSAALVVVYWVHEWYHATYHLTIPPSVRTAKDTPVPVIPDTERRLVAYSQRVCFPSAGPSRAPTRTSESQQPCNSDHEKIDYRSNTEDLRARPALDRVHPRRSTLYQNGRGFKRTKSPSPIQSKVRCTGSEGLSFDRESAPAVYSPLLLFRRCCTDTRLPSTVVR
ncbi:hypothetical protein PENSPDRAFT_33784 [Peniophora sp. CONT]|nr:hypothetical protein PENSPDRAFT_33784 [Peniophora sp. CONT]